MAENKSDPLRRDQREVPPVLPTLESAFSVAQPDPILPVVL